MSLFDDDPFDDAPSVAEDTATPAAQLVAVAEGGTGEAATIGTADTSDAAVEHDARPLKRPREDIEEAPSEETTACIETIVAESTENESNHVVNLTVTNSCATAEETAEDAGDHSTHGVAVIQQHLDSAAAEEKAETLSQLAAKNAQLQTELSELHRAYLQATTEVELGRCLKEPSSCEGAAEAVQRWREIVTEKFLQFYESARVQQARDDAQQLLIASDKCLQEKELTAARCSSLQATLDAAKRAENVWRESVQRAGPIGVATGEPDASCVQNAPPMNFCAPSVKEAIGVANRAAYWLREQAAAVVTPAVDSAETSSEAASASPVDRDALQRVSSVMDGLVSMLDTVATRHDALAAFAAHLDAVVRRWVSKFDAPASLEPRIALMREVVERTLVARAPTSADVALTEQVRQLQEKVAVLEAIAATYVLKTEYGMLPQAVVPQLLKEKIARCEELERQVAASTQELLAVHRVLAGEQPTFNAQLLHTPTVRSSPREELLEAASQRWRSTSQRALDWVSHAMQDQLVDSHAIRTLTARNSFLEAQLSQQTAATRRILREALLLHHRCFDANQVIQMLLHEVSALAHQRVEWSASGDESLRNLLQNFISASAKSCDASRDGIGELVAALANSEARLASDYKSMLSEFHIAFKAKEDALQHVVEQLHCMLVAADGVVLELAGLEQPASPLLSWSELEKAARQQYLAVAQSPAEAPVYAVDTFQDALRRSVQAAEDAHKEQWMTVGEEFRRAAERWRARHEWLLAQDGMNVVAELEKRTMECTTLRAEVEDLRAQSSQALITSVELAKTKTVLSEREARVASLEGQLRVSQERLAKSSQEVSSLSKLKTELEGEVQQLKNALQQQTSAVDALQVAMEEQRRRHEADLHAAAQQLMTHTDDDGEVGYPSFAEEAEIGDASADKVVCAYADVDDADVEADVMGDETLMDGTSIGQHVDEDVQPNQTFPFVVEEPPEVSTVPAEGDAVTNEGDANVDPNDEVGDTGTA